MGKVVTREWRKAKVLNWNLYSFQLLEIKFWTQYPGSVVPLAMF